MKWLGAGLSRGQPSTFDRSNQSTAPHANVHHENRDKQAYPPCYRGLGFSCPLGNTLTLREFAGAIRRHSTHARADVLALALESTTGFVTRDWRGLRARWEC